MPIAQSKIMKINVYGKEIDAGKQGKFLGLQRMGIIGHSTNIKKNKGNAVLSNFKKISKNII